MNVLMICTEKLPVPAVRGGAIQTYIDGISTALSKHHKLTILGTTDPSLPNDETRNGIRYVRTPGGLIEDYRDRVSEFLRREETTYDLIHIFNRPRLVLAVREAAPTARIVLSMHNDMFKREKIDPEEAEAAIEQLDKIITVSNYIGKTISDLFPSAAPKLKTIYSGVDIDRFLPPNSKQAQLMSEAIRKEHNLVGKKVILFAGRLSANKGADILVQAMPALAKIHPDIALVLVGSKWFSVNEVSDYVAYVRALAARLPIPVVNTGFVSPSEIQKWFSAADVFVCPSQWQEPLARVHYEAMASGLPIVTTQRGGNPEVIIPGENGYVVEQPENPQAFVDLLAPLLSDPKLRQKLGLKGRQLAEEKFTWTRVISDVMDVWNEVEDKINQNIPVTSVLSENEVIDEKLDTDDSTVQTETNDLVKDNTTEQPMEPVQKDTIIANQQVQDQVSQKERLSEPPMSKKEKWKSILLSELLSKDKLIEALYSNLQETTSNYNNGDGGKDNENKTINNIAAGFEQLLREQIQSSTKPQNEIINTFNDITTAKLFYKLKSKRRNNRRKKT